MQKLHSGAVFRLNYETGKFEREVKEAPIEVEAPVVELDGYVEQEYLNTRCNDIETPGKYDSNEPDVLTLARVVYSEVGCEWDNKPILYHKGSSVLNRSKDRGLSIAEATLEDDQYHAVARENFKNTGKVIESSNIERKAWEACYKVAEDLIEFGPVSDAYFTVHQKKGKVEPKKSYDWVRDALKNGDMELIEKVPTKTGTYHIYRSIQ